MLSVVIPLYNKGPHIADTLNKVLAQTVAPSEIIVVDDGSTDHGPEVVMSYAGHGVRLLRQANQGVSAARNAGLAEASSSYVAFLDADDEWLPDHIEQLSRLIHSHHSAALFSTAHIIRRDGHLIQPRLPFNVGWSGVVDDFFGAYANGLSLVNSSTACVRRDALQSVGGFPVGVRRGEDVIVWIRLAVAYPVAHSSMVTAIFNQEAVNRSDLNFENEPPDSLILLCQYIIDRNAPKSMQNSLSRLFDRMALMTAAGYRLNGSCEASSAIGELANKAGRYRVFLQIKIINIMPRLILKLARKLKNHKYMKHNR